MGNIKESILACIRGHRHRDYDRTVTVAEWGFSMMTGEDQTDALIKYHTRESAEQKEQRVRITSSKTQFATGNVAKYFNEVHRSDTVVDQLYYQDDADAKKKTKLRQGLDSFSQGAGLKEWLDHEFFYRQFYDPNSFLIIEWELDKNKNPLPYPLIIDAKDVMDFQYKLGRLQYVVIRQPKYYRKRSLDSSKPDIPKLIPGGGDYFGKPKEEKKYPGDEISGFEMQYKWTVYGQGETIELIQVPKEGVWDPADYPDFEIVKITVKNEDVTFLERTLTQNIDFCPAQRFGYFRDPLTKSRTFVTPLFPATKILDDLIHNKSEYDLTKTLHGFYQKFVYVSKCKKCQGTGEYINPKTKALAQCKTCKGEGKLHHQSTQDIVAITMPDKPDLMFDLSKLVHFAEIPQYVAELQKADVKEGVREVFVSLFSEKLFDPNQVPTTAQEARLNLRSMYNALHPYADHEVRMYKETIAHIAGIMEIKGGLVNNFAITKDYNMETLDDLFAQRQTAVTSGAPQVIIDQIDAKILKKQHQNDPAFLDEYEAIQQLKPLRDKTGNEILVIISSLDNSSTLKTQWVYFNDIIEAMKAENPTVFKMPYDQRKLAFDATTKQFQIANQAEQPQNLIAF